MSHRIDARFDAVRSTGHTAVIPFITAGDPDPEWTVDIMHALVAGGADLIELGVPFSDPMADGPVIQASSERAIGKGVSLETVLGMVGEFRRDDTTTPVVLMGYMNPVERLGSARLAEEGSAAGVDGMLLVDCPPEEATDLHRDLAASGIHSIRLIAPTTSAGRLDAICRSAQGFIYYVSFKGITGADRLQAESLAGPVAAIRERTDLPIAIGFGITGPESARAVAEYGDAVVIGSALVRLLSEESGRDSALGAARRFVASVRESLDNSGS